jgi:glycosyltransferase involved in cell wall biosynthesis
MENMDMRISVVVPAYNAARFLPRCIQSVRAQTLKPDEIIVIDDGSTDNTSAVAAGLGAKVITLANGGVAAARNTGIRNASGEWVALLDADDMWYPEKLERQAALAQPEVVLIYTGIKLFDEMGFREENPAADADTARRMMRYRNSIPTSSVLVRRETVLKAGGFREDISTCEDWDLWMRLVSFGQFAAITEPLTYYYVYPQSLSASPEKMLAPLEQIIEATLLSGLRGFSRWAWRRRIMATQLCSAGLIARNNGLSSELSYMVKSLYVWPSFFWEPHRFKMFAVSAKNAFCKR